MCFPAVSLHQIAFSWSIWSICLGPHISNVSHRSEKMAIKWEDAEDSRGDPKGNKRRTWDINTIECDRNQIVNVIKKRK